MSEMINVKIDNIPVTVEKGTTILDAARIAGVKIPTLCYLKDINAIGACRVCVCEVKGARSLVAACVYPLDREGTEVFTNTPKILEYRKTTVELILSDHDYNCTSCVRNRSCELQELALELGCDSERFKGEKSNYPVDTSTSYLIRDNNKCVLCRRCVAACKEYQAVAVIGANARGFDTHIACAFETNLSDNPCVGCGQCIEVCPTGALREKDEIDDVIRDLANPDKYVIVGTAPATRIGIGEEFGYPVGSNTEGKMVAALRRLGFNNVFDVDFTADLTIMEEGYEFLGRVTNGGVLPMMTSCSPGWIKFVEHYYPELIPNLSSCKSPQQMFGAVCKTYYAEKLGIPAEKISVVSIMPCTAKKFEKGRPFQSAAGVPDIDHVLTTRELARLIKRKGILFNNLPDEEYDVPFGIGSGAGLIFGVTGGVMEAALRTAAYKLDGKELKNVLLLTVKVIVPDAARLQRRHDGGVHAQNKGFGHALNPRNIQRVRSDDPLLPAASGQAPGQQADGQPCKHPFHGSYIPCISRRKPLPDCAFIFRIWRVLPFRDSGILPPVLAGSSHGSVRRWCR